MIHQVTDSKFRRVLAHIPLAASVLLLLALVLPRALAVRAERQAYAIVDTRGYVRLGASVRPVRSPDAPRPLPSVPVRDETLRMYGVRQTIDREAFAAASRADRRYASPTTLLPQSPWGDARWNPVTDEITWRPFAEPSPWFYIGAVRAVATGGNVSGFQSALNASVALDIVQIEGNITQATSGVVLRYPARGDSSWVLVRTSAYASLPAQGTKPTYATLDAAPKILMNTTYAGSMECQNDARGWHHLGVVWQNIRPKANGIAGTFLSWGGQTQSGTTGQPTYAIWEQCMMDGKGGFGTGFEALRGMAVSGDYWAIIDSLWVGFVADSGECKTIGGSAGRGHARIEHCTLQGQSMHVLFGGTGTPFAADYMSDILVRYCTGTRPAADLASTTTGAKNHLEAKNGQRHVWEGNYFNGHDAGGQVYDYAIGPKPQTVAESAWVRTWDICIRHSVSVGGVGAVCAYNIATPQPTPTPDISVLFGTNRIEYTNILAHSPYVPEITQLPKCTFLTGATNVRNANNLVTRRCTVPATSQSAITFGNYSTSTDTGAGFRFTDTVLFRQAAHAALASAVRSSGTGSNDGTLNQICGAGQWTCAGNLTNQLKTSAAIVAAMWGPVLGYAVGESYNGTKNVHKNADTMSFTNEGGGDYTLAESAYQTLSTTGGRPGVDMARLNVMQARIA